MSYGELTMAPAWTGVHAKTGQFLKGHVPHNKGRHWSDYMSTRAMKRSAKGWKNLELHRGENGRKTGGRNRKKVVAVSDDGRWMMFGSLRDAWLWLGRGSRENVGRCCRSNALKRVCKHNWRPGQTKGANPVNTDHKYYGFRFYFDNDEVWTTKIHTDK